MPISLWAYVFWMILVAATGIGLFIWGIRRKQFDDIEEPKYRMLEEKEPEPWPGRDNRQARKNGTTNVLSEEVRDDA